VSVDSNNKRRAAGNLPGWYVIYPVPDGTIDDLDRMQAAGFYPLGAGDPVAAPEPEAEAERRPAPGGSLGRSVRRRQIAAVTREYRDAEEELIMVALL
jgi:hypothetical protein